MRIGTHGGASYTAPSYEQAMALASRTTAMVDRTTQEADGVVGRAQGRIDEQQERLRRMSQGGGAPAQAPQVSASVDDELARMKAEMGLDKAPQSAAPETATTGGVTVSGQPGRSLASSACLTWEE